MPISKFAAQGLRQASSGCRIAKNSIRTATAQSLKKLAEDQLREYQLRVLDRLNNPDQKGLIAYHSMGSGKTWTALEAIRQEKDRSGKPGLYVAPAPLVKQTEEALKQRNIPLKKGDIEIIGYEKAVRDIERLLTKDYGMVVFDEAHRLRNANTARARNLKGLLDRANKSLLLTGTAGYNNPSDIATLVSLINKDSALPTDKKEFDTKFIDQNTWRLKNKSLLRQEMGPFVDVYDRPEDPAHFATTTSKVIRVPMSDRQAALYTRVEKQSIPIELKHVFDDDKSISVKDADKLNMFSTRTRQAGLSTMSVGSNGVPEDSNKLLAAANSIAASFKNKGFRGVAYSNYIDAGIDPYAEILRKKGINPYVLTGKLSQKQKQALVDEFNRVDDKAKVLLLSSSGGEGINLKGVRKLQILEPHFNKSKIDQVKGRAVRYNSHNHLPDYKRQVDIEEYLSTRPANFLNKHFGVRKKPTIDEILYDVSNKKQRLIDEMKEVIK